MRSSHSSHSAQTSQRLADGTDRAAGLLPVRHPEAVGIASGHLCKEEALTLATGSRAA